MAPKNNRPLVSSTVCVLVVVYFWFHGRHVIQRYRARLLNQQVKETENHVSYDGGEIPQALQEKHHNTCQLKENITFVKIHKTGSTTVQNILFRYGDFHNLSFVLPPKGIFLGYPEYFQRKFILESHDGIYNILCQHARYNDDAIADLMPPSTVYVTIIREPVTHYESYFTYYKLGTKCNIPNNDLSTFFNDPKRCYKKTKNNLMLYDLGTKETSFGNETELEQKIRFIDKRFSLIMIMEYFEESIVLLQELLCWHLDDFTFFQLNARKPKSVNKVDAKIADKIRSWNSGDAKLYDYFNKTFWGKVKNYGEERMSKDVKFLRVKNEVLSRKCLSDNGQFSKKFQVYEPRGVDMNNMLLKKDLKNYSDCENRVLTEKMYTERLRQKQMYTERLRQKQSPSK